MHIPESIGAMAVQTQVRRSRPLNTATLILNALAFPLLVPAALISTAHSGTEPAAVFFSFIPLFFSLCLAITYIALQKRQRRKQVKLLLPGDNEQGAWWLLFPVGDFLVFGGFLTMLIVMWVREPRNLSNDAGSAFFEAYATAPLVANMFIHFFFFVVNSYVLFRAIIPRPGLKDIDECPHCHRQISSVSEERPKGKGKEEGYSLLRGEDYDNDARRASEEGADAGEALIREV